jgi:phosphoglycolate phosphatase
MALRMSAIDLSSCRHAIWDWNGTLFDDTWLCIDVVNGLLRRRSLPEIDLARYHETFDFPIVEYYRRLGFDFEKEPFEQLGTEFMHDYESRVRECSLQRDAVAALSALRDHGFAQSVLSAYRHDTLETLLSHYGIRWFFGSVLGSDNLYGRGKLDQGRAWMAASGLPREQLLLLGDTVHDFEVAQAMGIACCLIADGSHPRSRLEPCGAPVLDSLKDLLLMLGP